MALCGVELDTERKTQHDRQNSGKYYFQWEITFQIKLYSLFNGIVIIFVTLLLIQ
jgi:hypothetical protein